MGGWWGGGGRNDETNVGNNGVKWRVSECGRWGRVGKWELVCVCFVRLGGAGGECVWCGVCNTCTSFVRLFKIVENYTVIQQWFLYIEILFI